MPFFVPQERLDHYEYKIAMLKNNINQKGHINTQLADCNAKYSQALTRKDEILAAQAEQIAQLQLDLSRYEHATAGLDLDALKKISVEMCYARDQHPEGGHIVALAKLVGETAAAALNGPVEQLLHKLTQVMVVAMRMSMGEATQVMIVPQDWEIKMEAPTEAPAGCETDTATEDAA